MGIFATWSRKRNGMKVIEAEASQADYLSSRAMTAPTTHDFKNAASPVVKDRRLANDSRLRSIKKNDGEQESVSRSGRRRSLFGVPKPVDEGSSVPMIPRTIRHQQSSQSMPTLRSVERAKRRKSWFGKKAEPDSIEAVPAVPALPSSPKPITDKNEKRKSMSRQKSSEALRKRLSWFGGKADKDTNVPNVPMLPSTKHERNRHMSRETPSPTADLIQQSASHGATSIADKRKSAAVPIPSPRSRPTSTVVRATSKRSRRKSWLAPSSSNPDDSDSDAVASARPPMPALTYSDSDTSPASSPDFRKDRLTYALPSPTGAGTDEPTIRSVRGNDIKQPRPVSMTAGAGNRKSYVPKNAASGFLKSTNGASDGARQSYRRSMRLRGMDDEDEAAMFFNDEQQAEWEKLKQLFENDKQADYAGGVGTLGGGGGGGILSAAEDHAGRTQRKSLFANDDALALLEFGVAR